MYDLRAIANYFIKRGLDENIPISPMKLQKLLYFAYGLYMANKGKEKPLFSERFEVWKYGPVISQLYHTLKGYGSRPIDSTIKDLDMKTFDTFTPTIDPGEKDLLKFLDSFWKKYKDYDAVRLSNATHLDGTPWKTALDKGDSVIDDEFMFRWFKNWIGQN